MLEHVKATERALAEELLEDKVEKQIVLKEASREIAADKVRQELTQAKVFALGHNASISSEDVSEGRGLLRYVVGDGSGIRVPVFTRSEFTEHAYEQNPAWKDFQVAELSGDVLLGEVGQDLTVVINPWSPLRFKLGDD